MDHVKFRLAQLEGVKELNADLLAPLSDLPNTPGSGNFLVTTRNNFDLYIASSSARCRPLYDLLIYSRTDANVSFQVVYECHGVQCFLIESFNEGNQIKRTDLAPNAHLIILKQA
jgi:hypothetical protein